MANRNPIKDFYGKTIGYIETMPNGDQIIRDFHMKTLGRYDKAQDTTRDFYGRTIAKGNHLSMLLSNETMKSYNKNTNKKEKENKSTK